MRPVYQGSESCSSCGATIGQVHSATCILYCPKCDAGPGKPHTDLCPLGQQRTRCTQCGAPDGIHYSLCPTLRAAETAAAGFPMTPGNAVRVLVLFAVCSLVGTDAALYVARELLRHNEAP